MVKQSMVKQARGQTEKSFAARKRDARRDEPPVSEQLYLAAHHARITNPR